MTEQELNLVKQLAANKDQREAVKKFILEALEPPEWLPQLDLTLDDSKYGQRVKVAVKAKNELLAAFEKIEGLLDKEKPKEIKNPAR